MSEDPSKFLTDLIEGKISTGEGVRRMCAYLDSPEYRRAHTHESKRLLDAKAGRARVYELIDEYRQMGFVIECWIVDLKEGHDSLMVRVNNRQTGFPSFLRKQVVEEAFLGLVKRADQQA